MRCRGPTSSSRSPKARASASSSSPRPMSIRRRNSPGPTGPTASGCCASAIIAGKELTCAVIGDKALGVIEIVPTVKFYDYEAKYAPGGSKHLLPAPLKPNVYQEVRRLALLAHQALGCRGVSRADFRYDDRMEGTQGLFCLEVNTQPGMTETSLVPELAAYAGITFRRAGLMDGGGRLAGSLNGTEPSRDRGRAAGARRAGRRDARRCRARPRSAGRLSAWSRASSTAGRTPRGCRARPGIAASIILSPPAAATAPCAAATSTAVDAALRELRDVAANAVGFNIAASRCPGSKHLNREEILATAGVTGRASLLFFDVADARARLLDQSLDRRSDRAEALPDRLVIAITERERVRAVAEGRPHRRHRRRRHRARALRVAAATFRCRWWSAPGRRCAPRNFCLARPLPRPSRQCARLGAGRRAALESAAQERHRRAAAGIRPRQGARLSSSRSTATRSCRRRDITAIDLRLPDRVTVQLSDAAAQARDEAVKKKPKARKGGSA